MLPVVLFLAAILVVAETCAAEGLFAAVGDAVRRAGRGDPHRVLLVTFLAASLITAALSLDATVVLLTPVVAAAVAGSRSERPVVHACVRLANSASLLLPVSNLTNLLALPDVDLSFLGWFLAMAPVWVVVIAVEYVGVRVYFAGDLRSPAPRPEGEPLPLPRFPVVVVLLMLAGFVAGSAYDLRAVLGGRRRRPGAGGPRGPGRAPDAGRTRCTRPTPRSGSSCSAWAWSSPRSTGRSSGRWSRTSLPAGSGLASLLLLALLATVLANLVNNLPATLLLVPLVAPLGTEAVLGAIIGLNVGSGLTYPGSLANLLWRRTLVRRGLPVSGRTFHLHAALVTPFALVAAVVTLWAVPGAG